MVYVIGGNYFELRQLKQQCKRGFVLLFNQKVICSRLGESLNFWLQCDPNVQRKATWLVAAHSENLSVTDVTRLIFISTTMTFDLKSRFVPSFVQLISCNR